MNIIFTKMQGLGNDFVVIDTLAQAVNINEQLVRKIAHRQTGIGCDQVLLVGLSDKPGVDFTYRIFNADGCEVGQCGNGARCVAQFVRDKGYTDKTTIVLETKERVLTATIDKSGIVSVDMGQPLFIPKDIPFLTHTQALTYTLTLPGITQSVSMSVLSMGNPHAVIIVPNLQTTPVATLGALIQEQPLFPQSVNVGFMQIDSLTHLQLRVYERGAGETLACGSGACAAAVAAIMQGVCQSPVDVTLPGGTLTIAWPGKDHSVKMTGPAVSVFSGVFFEEQ